MNHLPLFEIFLYSLGVIPVRFLNIFIKHISFPYPQRSDISLTVIIGAFRNIKAPVFRWPGGCFAEEAAVECSIFGFKASSVSCRILTNEVHSFNDFDYPDRVSISEHMAVIKDNVLKLNIPPCAVVECAVD